MTCSAIPPSEQPEYLLIKTMAAIMAGEAGMDMAYAIEVKGLPDGYRLGAGLQLLSGEASGRQLYCIGTAGDLFAVRRARRGQPQALRRGQGRRRHPRRQPQVPGLSATSTVTT